MPYKEGCAMKRPILKISLLSVIFTLVLASAHPPSKAMGFFDNFNQSVSTQITIGEWETSLGDLPTYDEIRFNVDEIEVGDRFIFEGKVFEFRRLGGAFDNNEVIAPTGDVLRSNGPFQEITNEWREYNTYETGDTVIFNDVKYEARNNGANNQVPGEGNAWQAITDEWQAFNTYTEGDTVIFDGMEYEARQWTQGDQPDESYEWQALTDEWQFFNTYDEGDIVIFEGIEYEAQYFTQGDAPDENVGIGEPWEIID